MIEINKNPTPTQQLLKMKISNQTIAIPIINIRDILIFNTFTKVPLSHDAIVGLINLRGRVVTAINVKTLLKMNDCNIIPDSMNVVIEIQNDLYSIIADSVEEVITICETEILPKPDNIDQNWHQIASGIILGVEELIIVINIQKLLNMLSNN